MYKPFFVLLGLGLFCCTYSVTAQEQLHLPYGEKSQRINNTPTAVKAHKPPMGWNSWDNWGLEITEAEFKTQVDYIATHLKKYGYEYMVIDAGWYSDKMSAERGTPYFVEGRISRFETYTDNFGRWIPSEKKFPSSVNGKGFKPLADYCHSKGLKFGMHIQRGIPLSAVDKDQPILNTNLKAKDIANPADMCDWWDGTYGIDASKPGAQEFYNSCAKLWASWGVDFIKFDDASRPYHSDEITMLRIAIENSGRSMILSLSPGETPISARYHVQSNSDMWRISDDFWDTWPQLSHQFELVKKWLRYTVPGRWADLDMIPFGKIGLHSYGGGSEKKCRFTEDEQGTMMTLWAMFRSPLILGMDVTQLDNTVLPYIANEEVIAVNQNSANCWYIQEMPKNQEVFYADEPNTKNKYVAFFNRGEAVQTIEVDLDKVGIQSSVEIRDLWKKSSLGKTSKVITVQLKPHSAALYKLSPQ